MPARRLHRAVMLGIACAPLASAGCWLALGIQDRTQAEETGGSAGTGPDGGGCDGSLQFGVAQVYPGHVMPSAITVDPGHVHVFWIDYDLCHGDSMWMLSKVDGALPPAAVPIVTDQPPLSGLASDGLAVWTAVSASTGKNLDGGMCNFSGGVARIVPEGGAPGPNWFPSSLHVLGTVSRASNSVAFSDLFDHGGSIWVGSVSTQQLYHGPLPLQGDAGKIVAIAAEKAPARFYWQGSGRIWGADPEGMPECVALANEATSMVADDNGWLYWTDGTGGTVNKVSTKLPPTCTDAGIVMADGLDSPTGLALSGTDVYWVSNSVGGAVSTVPIASSGQVTPNAFYHAVGAGVPTAAATDGDFVYVTIDIDNEVVAIPILCH